MTGPARAAVAGVLLLLALVLQVTVLSRVPTAGTPDPVLVLVVALALVGGPVEGAFAGFVGGLALDAWGDHPVGALALTLTVVGHLAGHAAGEVQGRTLVVPAVVVGLSAVAAPLLFAGITAALGEPRVTPGGLVRVVPLSVLYDLLLVPVLMPVVSALLGRSGRFERLR